ncbi:apolipoprotein N-acyltransferase [Oceanicoccus sp. KOV_DT_Chl]|uniref:apolipoprotein N-acyltransferase n=1 Tax=Oceanicoccus sp. KOV_DT_Chl TaxID=1904639 RepID=UPI001F32DB86|nr:apolipoprotein N-acyltransferase [Oceanicoccus sp. KOV_DT_Chl]
MAAKRPHPGAAAKRSWFYGLGLFGSGTSWVYVSIHVYGYAPAPLASFLTLLFSAGLALFSAGTGYAYARFLRHKPLGRTVGFAAIVVLGEWWRSWFLTGFPWLYLGYAHIDTPLAGWAPVAGIYTLSFIVALTGAVLAQILQQRNNEVKSSLVAALGVVTLWLLGAGLNMINWTRPVSDQAVSVAMVQANIPQEIKWNRDQYLPTLAMYKNSSAPLWPTADIVIWPEAAIPAYYQQAKGFVDDMAQQANQYNATLITGIPYLYPATDQQARRYHNSIMAVGAGSGTYHKQRLVPFGEYVPLENLLRGLIQFFDLPMSAFSAGPANQPAIKAGKISLAPFICYEIVYPDLVSQWLPEADMLITISNDAWFGASIGPLQHLQMAQMRALEAGRYLLRATGTGISAIIDQRGQITVQGKQFQREIIRGQAYAYQGMTPFALAGSWPILLICWISCLAVYSYSSGLFAAKMRD